MSLDGNIHAPEFPPETEWLNTARPLSLADLAGKIVLPELKALERAYPDELVVIGVHSAKFDGERSYRAIEAAIRRYDIEHPVINDHDFKLWKAYGIRAWPSFMLINPTGRIIGAHSGEGIHRLFDTMIRKLIAHFDPKGLIDRSPLNLSPPAPAEPAGPLRFPGKVTADPVGDRLFISDTAHHRILVTDPDGRVLDAIGTGEPGFDDGGFDTATLWSPQGVLRLGRYLYVCDTENHAIRAADLETRTLTTLVGTGKQARMPNVSGKGLDVRLNSPWDVVAVGDSLYVAMAGPHQIWRIGTVSLEAGPYAGSGREDLEDARLQSAALAQPSGITTDGSRLYFADSEVSAIRCADLNSDGYVRTLVGKGLFDFGDAEGAPETARLQHPLGVVWHAGNLYVADTYNARIKQLDPETGRLTNLAGTGQPGHLDGPFRDAQFDEPSGITALGAHLYVADTNNHAIRRLDLETQTVSTVDVVV